MGSYISTSKFIQLPFRGKKSVLCNQEFTFCKKSKNREIIDTIINSNISHIQTEYEPSKEEVDILNEIFKNKQDIIFRHYGGWGNDSVDILYLSKLSNLRHLYLDLYPQITNIDILQKLELYSLRINCFNVKDYGFLKGVSSSIKDLTIDLEDKTYKMDINDIVHMKDLEKLEIRNVKKGLDKLAEFNNLKELYLRSINIKDYRFLKQTNVKKIYLSFQKPEYFNTFEENKKIEEVSLWMNKNLTDLSFLLQFPNLKKIIISSQKKVEIIPDLSNLKKLEEIYFLDRDVNEIRKYCSADVKIYNQYNPADIN